ncbi:MAG: methyl-accepting chemotaxis protein [Fervidobacterium sp.]
MHINDLSEQLVKNFKNHVVKSILIILLLVDPPALLFSYYIFAGLGSYPVWIILLGYIISLVTFGLLTLFISGKLTVTSLKSGTFNLPISLAVLLFAMNFVAATLVGIFAKYLKSLPEETLMLRLSGALAINLIIVAIFIALYSRASLLKEHLGERYKNVMIPISLKLVLGVLAVSLWIAPILLKYLILKVGLPTDVQKNFVITSLGLNVILATSVIFLTKRILRSIPNIIDVLDKISKGDLSKRLSVESVDEFRYIANELNLATKGISKIIKDTGNISENSAQVLNDLNKTFDGFEIVANQTFEAVNVQQQGIERITSSVEEISANIEQLSYQSQSLADLAVNVQRLADTLDQKSKSSVDELERVRNITTGFVREYENLESGIMELTEATKNIGNIIETVRSIAEQTNLLALNAAIEAARAGEAGRGFAVVADEIRKLAEETKKSTDTITSTIALIEQSSKNLNQQIEHLRKEIISTEEGYEKLFDTFSYLQKAIDELSSSIDTLAAHSEEQNASAEEMRSGANEITESISRISMQGDDIANAMRNLKDQLDEISRKIDNTLSVFTQLKSEIEKFKLE